MILKVRKQTFVTYVPRTQYYISAGKKGVYDTYLLKDGTISTNASNGWWHSKVEAKIFLAGWLVLNPPPTPDVTKVDTNPQFELGTRYVDSAGRRYRYVKVEFGHDLAPIYQWAGTTL